MSSHSRWIEIFELTRVRLLIFVREPEAIFWVFAFPLILAIALGLAFRDQAVDPGVVGVVSSEEGASSLVAALEAAPHLEVHRLDSLDEGNRWLRTGKVAVLVADVPGGAPTLRFDPTRPESEMCRMRVEDAIQRGAGRRDPLTVSREEVTETGSRYIDWLIPGLLGMNLLGTGVWGIGFAIADARQKKLLKRFLVTPMRKSSYLLSFFLSRLVFLVLEVAVILGFAVLFLGVPLRGSVAQIALLTLLGAFAFAGLGFLIAARPRTIEGVSGLMNLVMMPMWVCSGVFFSYHRFPESLHPWIEALPLTALNNALRSLILEGEGLGACLQGVVVLASWGGGCFLVALKIFRWR